MSHLNGLKYSTIAPTSRINVDPTSHQKYTSAVCIKAALMESSVGSVDAISYSREELPLWPVWIAAGLFAVFLLLLMLSAFRVP